MDSRLAAAARRRGGVFTRSDAIEAGYSPAEILARLRARSWRTVRRGVYVAAGVEMTAHLQMAAALAVLPPTAALSHRSAAVLHALPLVGTTAPIAEVTVPGAGARRRDGMAVHGRALPAAHVTHVHDLRVTTLARTALDLARRLAHPSAVAVVDSVLRRGVSGDQLLALAEAMSGPYRRKAIRAISFGDVRAESPGESLSRVAIASYGLPAPDLQAWIVDDGRALARVDFLWPQHRTIGEFDGRLKYDAPSALWEEKRREDSLRARGYQVVRWTWDDAFGDFSAVARRLRQAFALGDRSVPHTG